MDASHFVFGAFLGVVWCVVRWFVQTGSGRQRWNILGAVDVVTHKIHTVMNDTYITSTQVCEMLRKLAAESTLPITIVLDNARYQRCKLVMNTASELGIELLFLPTYSPNLNLIERLWKLVKKRSLRIRYLPNFDAFREALIKGIEDLNENGQKELATLMAPNFQSFKDLPILKR